jgi:hypothetical protein
MEKFSVTPESRAEDLTRWETEELWTLHERLAGEIGRNIQVTHQIEQIILEREGFGGVIPEEYFGERPEL